MAQQVEATAHASPEPPGRGYVNPIMSLLTDSSLFEKILYCFLIFVPLAFVAEFAHFDDNLIFIFACLGVVPLAKIMGTATEEIASKTGQGIGGLLNATFGNAVELIIAVFGLIRAQTNPALIGVVKASITGSIIGNLLFVLGLSLLLGGWKREKQIFNRTAASAGSVLLTVAVIALVMPTIFGITLPAATTPAMRTDQFNQIETLSLWVAGILIVSYIAQLVFSLRTHDHLYTGEGQEHEEGKGWNLRDSILVLVGATVLVGFMAEFLVGSVESITKNFGWTELFVGVIVIALIGNAAEHLTAVLVALKDKMDLAIGIAIGSSTQVASFVAPVLVFVGFFLGGSSQLNLYFSPFELVAIVLAIFITNFIVQDGESNWLEGFFLLAAYAIIAVAFFLHPPIEELKTSFTFNVGDWLSKT